MGELMIDAIGRRAGRHPGRGAQPRARLPRPAAVARRRAVNPEIEWSGEEQETLEEGCLSLPGVHVDVDRAGLHPGPGPGRTRRADHDRGLGPRGSRDPARDRPSRRRARPRPHLPRAAQGSHAGAARGAAGLIAAGRLMRTVYLGTSAFAAGRPARAGRLPHRPSLVVTRPDRPRGRGRRLAAPPVADAARELGLELAQPDTVNDDEARAADRRRRARGDLRVRVRRADQGAAAVRPRDAQRPSLPAAPVARGGAGRAGDHGRRRAAPASRSCA